MIITHLNRNWEVTQGKWSYLLNATDRLRPAQILMSIKDYENLDKVQPKNKSGELYILSDGKQEYKRGSYILCRQEKERLKKLSQHKNTTFKIT